MNFALEYALGSSLLYCSKIGGMSYKTTGVDCRDIYVEYYSTHIAPTKLQGEIEINEFVWQEVQTPER